MVKRMKSDIDSVTKLAYQRAVHETWALCIGTRFRVPYRLWSEASSPYEPRRVVSS